MKLEDDYWLNINSPIKMTIIINKNKILILIQYKERD